MTKIKVADLGTKIDPDAVIMINKGYVDDGSGGGSMESVDRWVGDKVKVNLTNTYDGNVAQIFKPGGFTI